MRTNPQTGEPFEYVPALGSGDISDAVIERRNMARARALGLLRVLLADNHLPEWVREQAAEIVGAAL